MSRNIDERVVEMRFENDEFEKNVKESMGTLERLKQALRFEDSAEGFKNLGRAASNVDFDPLYGEVDTLSNKFGALEIAALTTISNITNRAVDASIQLAESLSIDQVTAGWQKYEQETASVQTIMAATGESIDEVSKYLEKLQWYTDETSYSYTDMTNNIAKFTSARVPLEIATDAMIGIANAAALAGVGASGASHAMTGFSKAISTGYMKNNQWMWIETAKMNTAALKEQFIEAAVAAGTLEKAGEGLWVTLEGNEVSIENFNTALKDGWLNKEVMLNTLNMFSEYTNAIYDIKDEYDTASEAIRDFDAANTDMAKSLSALGFKAGQEAKTFTEAIDSVKDAVSSGWKDTFKLIFGDYVEAKELWTDVANALWDVFAASGETRNEILKSALTARKVTKSDWIGLKQTGYDALTLEGRLKDIAKTYGIVVDDMISESGSFEDSLDTGWLTVDILNKALGETVETSEEVVGAYRDMTEAYEDYMTAATKTIRGDFGNGAVRPGLIEQAGYDAATVQEIVNRLVRGEQVTLEDFTEILPDAIKDTIGLVAAMKDIGEAALSADAPLKDLIDEVSQRPNGRALLLESIANIFDSFLSVSGRVKSAFTNIFGVIDEDKVYRFIEGLHRFSEWMQLSDDNLDKLQTGFEGLFRVIKLPLDGILALGRALSPLLQLVDPLIQMVIDGASHAGEVVGNMADAISSSELIADSFLFVKGILDDIVQWILGGIDSFNLFKDAIVKTTKPLQTFTWVTGSIQGTMTNMWNTLLTSYEEGGRGIRGIVFTIFNEIREFARGIFDLIFQAGGPDLSIVSEAVSDALNGIRNSAANAIAGIGFDTEGLSNKIVGIFDTLKSKWGSLKSWLSNVASEVHDAAGRIIGQLSGDGSLAEKWSRIDWIDILGGAELSGIFYLMKKIADSFKMVGIKDISKGVTEALDALTGSLNALSNNLNAKSLMYVAAAVAALAGAMVLISNFVDPARVESSTVAVVGLVAACTIALAVLSKLSDGGISLTKNGFASSSTGTELVKAGIALMTVAAAVGILAEGVGTLANALKGVENIQDVWTTLIGILLGFITILAVSAFLLSQNGEQFASMKDGMTSFIKRDTGMDFIKIAAGLWVFATAFSKMAGALSSIIAIVGEEGGFEKSQYAILAMGEIMVLIFAFVTLINKFAKSADVSKAKATIISVVAAITFMYESVKLLGNLPPEVLSQGTTGIRELMRMITEAIVMMSVASQIPEIIRSFTGIKTGGASGNLKNVAKTMLSFAVTLLALTEAISIIGLIPDDQLKQGLESLFVLTVLIGALIAVIGIVNQSGNSYNGVAGSVIGIAIAFGVLAGVVALMGALPFPLVGRGLLAVTSTLAVMVIAVGALALIASKANKPLKDLGLAMLGVGAGVALFAIGIMAAITAIALFSGAVDVLLTAVMLIATGIGLGLVAIATVFAVGLAGMAPLLASSIVILGYYLCEIIIQLAEPVSAAFFVLTLTVLKYLDDNVEEIVERLVSIIGKIITGVLKGLTNFTERFTDFLGGILDPKGEHTGKFTYYDRMQMEMAASGEELAETNAQVMTEAADAGTNALAEADPSPGADLYADKAVAALADKKEVVATSITDMFNGAMGLDVPLDFSTLETKMTDTLDDIADNGAQNLSTTFGKTASDGISGDATKQVTDALSTLIGGGDNSMVTTMASFVPEFTNGGINFDLGLAQGIEEGSSPVLTAIQSLCDQMKTELFTGLDEHSPSRLSEQAGSYWDAGIENGLYKGIPGIRNAIRTIVSEIQNGDIDQPVIRPVLDLSNVEYGAKRIGGILGTGKTLQLARAGISSGAYRQNGYAAAGGYSGGNTVYFTFHGYSVNDGKTIAKLVNRELGGLVR